MRLIASIYFLILVMLNSFSAYAQNLVPNPSFEAYNICPYPYGAINYSPTYTMFTWVQDWVNPLQQTNPDYHNACVPFPGGPSVPYSGSVSNPNFQHARTGLAYVFIVLHGTTTNADTREYIACKLISPLIAGKKYDVGFYVSLPKNVNNSSSDRIGAHLDTALVFNPAATKLLLSYSVKNQANNFLTDTLNWIEVKGIYTATGGEKCLVIGCFDNQANLPPITTVSISYFVDDVTVKEHCDTIAVQHDSSICDMAMLPVQLSAPAAYTTYIWSTGSAAPSIAVNDTGLYWRRAETGCNIYTDTFRLSLYKQVINSAFDTVVCAYDSLHLQIASVSSAQKYSWSTGAQTASIIVTEPGIYRCEAVKDCNLYIDSFNISTEKNMVVKNHDTVVCLLAKPFEVLLSSVPGAAIYQWSTGATTESLKATDTGMYWCTARAGCTIYTDTFRLRHKYFDIKPELGTDILLCKNETNSYEFGSEYDGVTAYKWNSGETVCCINTNKAGVYILTITDGCTQSSDTVTLDFVDNCNDCVYAASAFTPNHDGLNDNFGGYAKCILKSYSLSVYNRFGQELFQSTDINTRWDGSFKGAYMPLGTYYYMIVYSTAGSNTQYIKKGDVALVR